MMMHILTRTQLNIFDDLCSGTHDAKPFIIPQFEIQF